MKCPKSKRRRILTCDGICSFNCPKTEGLPFQSFCYLKTGHIFFIRNASLLCSKYYNFEIGKRGHFKYFDESGAFWIKSAWPVFKQQMTVIEVLRFWGISNKNANVITRISSSSYSFWGISYYSPWFHFKHQADISNFSNFKVSDHKCYQNVFSSRILRILSY